MRLSIIGTGYVGLVTGVCFAEMGNEVYCVDHDEDKISNLKKGIVPIYEPKLENMVKTNCEIGNLYFTVSIKESLEKTKICFIAVGTPMNDDGSTNLSYVESVAHDIGKYMVDDLIIVTKSTVPVGTADLVTDIVNEELRARGQSYAFSVASNPEFLKEGSAVDDCMRPDRVVIGTEDEHAIKMLKELYYPFIVNRDRYIVVDTRSSEMIKYASNAMLATRISFMNEIANICEMVGADVNKVRLGVGADARIGYNFLYAGCGYGGSCFPKDVQSLISVAKQNAYTSKLLEEVENINRSQKQVIAKKIVKRFGENLDGFTFAVWGLAFKPNTDDMREAPSITIIEALTKRGALIQAFDPKAMVEAKHIYLKDNPNITYFENKYDVLTDCDALIVITEWRQFKSPDFDEIANRLKNNIIFDGRNLYSKFDIGMFEYHQIGVRT